MNSIIHPRFGRLLLPGLLWWLIAGPSAVQGQDPVFTQYFATKLYLNPAFAGYEPGTVFSSGLRSQWHQVANGEGRYLTNHAEISQELPGFMSGFGLTYTDNSEGEGIYRPMGANTGLFRWQRYTMSYAWHSWACDMDERKLGFSLGFSGGYNRYVLNWERFRFGDQLDPIYGVVRGTGVDIPDGGVSGTSFFDLSAGGIGHFIQNPHRMYRLGLALHHINLQNNSVAGRDERLPTRITIHGSGILHSYREGALQTQWQWNPGFRVDLQGASARQGWPRDSVTGRPFLHGIFSLGGAVKTPGLTRLTAGLWYQGNMPLAAARRYRDGIHSMVLYGGLEFIQEARSGYSGSFYELGFSWDHNFGGARSLGDIFELTLSVGLPGSSPFGLGCGSCTLRRVLNRF